MEAGLSVIATVPGWPFKASVWPFSDSGGNSGAANTAATSEEGVADGEAAVEVELLSFNTGLRTCVQSGGGGGGGGFSSAVASIGGTNSLLLKGSRLEWLLFSAAALPAGSPGHTSSLAELFSILDDLPLGRRMVFFSKVEVFLSLRSCPVFFFTVVSIVSKASTCVFVLP